MFGRKEKIRKDIAELYLRLERLQLIVDGLKQSLSSMRGMINRKLYSGKLEQDEPSWLDKNMEMIGLDKNKKDTLLNI